MNKKPQSITFQRAAAELCVSDSTILRLIERGSLHATKPELVDGHWTRRIFWDKSFLNERARRLNGLKAPRRKHIPAAIDPLDPSPIQTVTPPAEPQPAFLVSARAYLASWNLPQPTLCIRYNTASFNFDGEAERLDRLVARAEACADYVMTSGGNHEDTCTRCTAVLAAACVLQLLLAIYYTLCHFNII